MSEEFKNHLQKIKNEDLETISGGDGVSNKIPINRETIIQKMKELEETRNQAFKIYYEEEKAFDALDDVHKQKFFQVLKDNMEMTEMYSRILTKLGK